MKQARVAVRRVGQDGVLDAVRDAMESCCWQEVVGADSRVAIKPNLCTTIPNRMRAANTSLDVIESVIKVLQSKTNNIVVVEGDGPRHTADQAFEVSGLVNLARETGVRLLNLCNDQLVTEHHPFLGDILFPRTLLDSEVLISLPTLKTHALTYFTGSIKNLWGCVPRPDRILYHRFIDRYLTDLCRKFPPRISVMDGIIGMDQRGPVNGRPRDLGIVLASRDPVALDAASMRVVRLDPAQCSHIRLAADEGLGVMAESAIELDADAELPRVTFEPARMDWALRAMNALTGKRWFRDYFLFNDLVFYPAKWAVNVLRRVGIVR